MPKILSTYTDDEREFIARVTGQPLCAAAVRAALRQWAIWTLQDGVDDLFLPREKGANLRKLTTEQKSAAAKKRWAKRKPPPE
jgi:glutaredoxin 2